jgi:hypothetical protein
MSTALGWEQLAAIWRAAYWLRAAPPKKHRALPRFSSIEFMDYVFWAVLRYAQVRYGASPRVCRPVRYLLLGLVAAILCVWIIGPEFFLRFFPKHRFTAKLQEMCTVLPRRPGALFAITLVAIAFHLLQLSLHIPISIGVGTPLTFSQILTTIPIVNIVSTLPISWQGLGVRENAYRFFLAGLLAPEAAIAFGAIWFVAVTLASAIGGIVAAVTGDLKKDLTAAPLVTRPSGSLP